VREKIKLSGIEDGGQDYGWMRIFVGLMEKLEFKLITSTGQVGAFDADIIKSIAVMDGNARVKEITFSSDGDEDLLLAEGISSHDCLLSGKSFFRLCARAIRFRECSNYLSNTVLNLTSECPINGKLTSFFGSTEIRR
jgi:hypothetical protein